MVSICNVISAFYYDSQRKQRSVPSNAHFDFLVLKLFSLGQLAAACLYEQLVVGYAICMYPLALIADTPRADLLLVEVCKTHRSARCLTACVYLKVRGTCNWAEKGLEANYNLISSGP